MIDVTPEHVLKLEAELRETRLQHWRLNRRQLFGYARQDPNVFIEQVIRDEDGIPLVQDPIHESWFRFMAYARRIGRYAGILAPFGHGKCQPAWSKIQLADGREVPLGDLEGQEFSVAAFDSLCPGYTTSRARCFLNGVRSVSRFRLWSGRSIDVTDEHPFWTEDGWVRAGDLEDGCSVGIAKDNAVGWTRIVSIEDIGEHETFGVEVDDHHTYISEGVIVHNSAQMVGFSAYVVGRRPQVRIKYVSNKFDLAKQRVQAVRRIIEHSDEYHTIFPDVVAMREKGKSKEEWGASRFRVKSTSGATDPTMEAFGVLATGAGGRADLVLLDDPMDMENTIHKPADRPKVHEAIQGTWLTRLVGTGFAVCISTRLHESDAVGQMLTNEGWAWLIQRVSQDYRSISSEIVLPGWRGDNIPKWDTRKLRMAA